MESTRRAAGTLRRQPWDNLIGTTEPHRLFETEYWLSKGFDGRDTNALSDSVELKPGARNLVPRPMFSSRPPPVSSQVQDTLLNTREIEAVQHSHALSLCSSATAMSRSHSSPIRKLPSGPSRVVSRHIVELQAAVSSTHINCCFTGGTVSVRGTPLKTEAAAPAPESRWRFPLQRHRLCLPTSRATIASERTGLSQNSTKTCAIVGKASSPKVTNFSSWRRPGRRYDHGIKSSRPLRHLQRLGYPRNAAPEALPHLRMWATHPETLVTCWTAGKSNLGPIAAFSKVFQDVLGSACHFILPTNVFRSKQPNLRCICHIMILTGVWPCLWGVGRSRSQNSRESDAAPGILTYRVFVSYLSARAPAREAPQSRLAGDAAQVSCLRCRDELCGSLVPNTGKKPTRL
ncbi:uncharacterized protein CLUP02_17342 [Colletotrichum lupini]|uniref:Uncharacterized protein n=1 Tax=Colletotrichum lupini TaxID=145971 RepID=A0A9Q8W9P6_9PEZI|nr:uncharacterized protein CLUP02_17342 [Colletotrichum lupini]UQC75833.1 hypothetical protein CLUP02_17342 [Colletotrichum lupini]